MRLNHYIVLTASMLVVFALADVLLAADRVVYFQVSYRDGSARDLTRVPDTNKGILRVVRMTRIEQGTKSYQILSTGRRPIRTVNAGKSTSVELKWNGKAWVGPKPPASQPDAALIRARKDKIRDLKTVRASLNLLLSKREQAVVQASKNLSALKGKKGEKAAAASLADAIEAFQICKKAISNYDNMLKIVLAAPKAPQIQAGKLAGTISIAPSPGASDVQSHRVQAWPLPVGKGKRTYSVAMAHAEAGVFGEFRYVAYADTDGDGVPDKLIARSPLAQSQKSGGWTSWTFTTSYERVFVGNTWPRADLTHLRKKRTRKRKNRDECELPDEIFISGYYGAVPTQSHKFWPYLHNIRVRLNDGDDDDDDDDDEPVMIIRHREQK